MNFCGLICEFNPFHNGHEYIIKEAKRQTQAEVLCLMSGNFVQRGTLAIMDKYTRAKHAICAGANAVLELPTIYACSNAENFATGAIKIFKALNVKYLAFGIESTNLEILQKIADLKYENSERFKNAFKNEIENGINYNTALKRSIAKCLGEDNIKDILDKPNNILAIEYLTAIKKLDAKITPVAITRIDNGYNSTENKNEYLSASSIRTLIENNKNYKKFVPEFFNEKDFLSKQETLSFETLLIHTLRNLSAKELEKFYDYSEGIEYRVKKISDNFSTLKSITENIATPRYRVSRVNKLLLYPLLKITKSVVAKSQKTKPTIKVLAIKKENKYLLCNYNKSKINLIASINDYNILNKNQKEITGIDLNASNIYNTIKQKQNNSDKKTGTMFI